jgi:putative integral membrane protein (TIGR02587 family)
MTRHRRGEAAACRDELDDALRGLASGFLIGVPVVFTVDSWWLGDQVSPREAIEYFIFTYALTFVAVHWIGFRPGHRSVWQSAGDALEALALAALTLFFTFGALGQLGGQPFSTTLGRLAVAVPPVSLGIAVANYLLQRDPAQSESSVGAGQNWQSAPRHGSRAAWHELGAAAAGALFVCMAIVPGDELNDIATEVPVWNLPLVVVLSLLVSYIVVFAAGFSGEPQRRRSTGPMQHPVLETGGAYGMALIVALASLWLFGHVERETDALLILEKTVLLGFPAAIGAAAGRIAI